MSNPLVATVELHYSYCNNKIDLLTATAKLDPLTATAKFDPLPTTAKLDSNDVSYYCFRRRFYSVRHSRLDHLIGRSGLEILMKTARQTPLLPQQNGNLFLQLYICRSGSCFSNRVGSDAA
jgi:hypothetical protein